MKALAIHRRSRLVDVGGFFVNVLRDYCGYTEVHRAEDVLSAKDFLRGELAQDLRLVVTEDLLPPFANRFPVSSAKHLAEWIRDRGSGVPVVVLSASPPRFDWPSGVQVVRTTLDPLTWLHELARAASAARVA